LEIPTVVGVDRSTIREGHLVVDGNADDLRAPSGDVLRDGRLKDEYAVQP
jgi:hypothetical protein